MVAKTVEKWGLEKPIALLMQEILKSKLNPAVLEKFSVICKKVVVASHRKDQWFKVSENPTVLV